MRSCSRARSTWRWTAPWCISSTGDVLVQRGTIHNWINRGTEPCVVAFVLVAAKPVERAGKLLTAAN